jgi:hypothetical protein
MARGSMAPLGSRDLGELLQQALRSEADAVEPQADGLARIRARLRRPRPLPVAWALHASSRIGSRFRGVRAGVSQPVCDGITLPSGMVEGGPAGASEASGSQQHEVSDPARVVETSRCELHQAGGPPGTSAGPHALPGRHVDADHDLEL